MAGSRLSADRPVRRGTNGGRHVVGQRAYRQLAGELFALCDMVHNVPAWLATEPSYGKPLELLLRYASYDPLSVRWLRSELSGVGRQDVVERLDDLVEAQQPTLPTSVAQGQGPLT